MPIRVLLTLDLFLHRWNEDDGQLWACVQPHVERNNLLDWVDRLETGGDLSYAMIRRDVPTPDVVPVSFPDASDLSLRLDAGAAGTRLLTNRRRTGLRVTEDGRAQIALDNREPDRRFGSSPGDEVPNPAALYIGPFAPGYNRTIRDAKAGRLNGGSVTDPAGLPELAQMLQVAFWGGTRRRIRATAMEALDQVHLMRLPDSVPGQMLVTNLHGLNGLMFFLGRRRDDLDFLLQVRDLEILLHGDDPAAPQHALRLGSDPAVAPSIPAYFSHLREPVPAEIVGTTFEPSFARRVYAVENATAFAPMGLAGRHWFRRRRERRAPERRLDLRDVTRLVVHLQGDLPAAPPVFRWRLHETLEGRLLPYREYPVEAARGAGRGAVVRLIPSDADRERFYERLAQDPDCLEGAQILRADGTAIAPEWLRCFFFPWDQDTEELADPAAPMGPGSLATVLLYVSASPPSPEVTIAIPQRHGGAPVEIETPPVGFEPVAPDRDHHGPRWERDLRTDGRAVRFDILECVDPHGLAERLIPAICVRGDAGFEFAQSASKIEGRLEVRYPPEPQVTRPEDVRPLHDHVEDLANYNALNVFSTWGSRPRRWLNPFGELYPPVPTVLGTDLRRNLFHFGYSEDVFQPPREAAAAPGVPIAAPFFAAVYQDLGAPRIVELGLEHTYGLSLDAGGPQALATYADFPVALPTAAVRAEPAPGEREGHFVTVSYRREGNEERAVLHFLTAWLRPELYQDETNRVLHLAAWRAVAELAHAERITLAGRFRRFDFRAALRSADSTAPAAGLRPVEPFESRSWDITREFGALCRRWLERREPVEPFELAVTLTGPGGPRISDTCNVIELRLEVGRAAAKAPGPVSSWDLVRPLPVLDDQGQKVEAVADDAVVASFQRFLDLLRRDAGVLEGSEEERQAAEIVRRVLAEADPDEDVSGAWLVPEGFTVQHSGDAVAAICPLAFLPVERHSYLGDGTFRLLALYLKALQSALSCRLEEWARTRSADDWRLFFEALERSLPALGRVTAALTSLLLPLPAPDNPDLEPEVKKVVEALRGGEAPARAFRGWLARQIWGDFALFADAKAFLFSRMSGSTAGGLLPEDFFQLASEKRIRDGIAGEPPLVDRDRFSFRQGLSSLAETSWFGFPEVLDDLRYDNEFVFEAFRLPSFEGVLEQLGAERPDTSGRAAVPLAGNVLHLPGGAQTLGSGQRIEVALASRRPVIAPVHVFTGDVELFQTGEGAGELRPGDRFRLQPLLQGRFERPVQTQEREVILEARSPSFPFRRSTRLDDTVVTAIFAIRGDEEAATSWTNAFNNDEFLLDIQRVAAGAAAATVTAVTPPDPPAGVATLFDALTRNPAPDAAVLNAALSADALAFVSAGLRAQEPPSPDVGPVRPRLRVRERVPGREVEIQIVDGHRGTPPLEALFLRGGGAGAGDDPDLFFLVVNVEVPVWFPVSVGLIHTRNLGRGFAREFGQVSRLASDELPFQALRVEPVQRDAVSLARTRYTLQQLIQRALIDTGILVLDQPAGEPPYWSRFDLSVTVYHEQRVALQASFRDPATGRLQETLSPLSSSVFPLRNLRFLKEDPRATQEETWFVDDYVDYALDFQWSSATNLQFFRLEGLRVRIT